MPRPSGGPPYLVSVRPLVTGAGRHVTGAGAVVALFVRDPASARPAEMEVLREAFGLTEAEADLARAIQAGVSLPHYAQARAISLNTVYTHLRHVKEKTGTNRTVELILKLNSVRMPLAARRTGHTDA